MIKSYLPSFPSVQAEIESTRNIFEDGIRLVEGEWEKHRLIAFIMRPNYGMRNRLRRTMNNLVHLHATGSTTAATTTAPISSVTTGNTTDAIESSSHRSLAMSSGAYRSERRRSNAGRTLEPCIGLHIRHGDAVTDHRGRSNLDRSLGAHASCVKTFAAALGASNIFLATDNVTLFTAAPREFPEYGWYAQRRALRKYEKDQADSHHHERSKQQEVANMLVRTYRQHQSLSFILSHMLMYVLVPHCVNFTLLSISLISKMHLRLFCTTAATTASVTTDRHDRDVAVRRNGRQLRWRLYCLLTADPVQPRSVRL